LSRIFFNEFIEFERVRNTDLIPCGINQEAKSDLQQINWFDFDPTGNNWVENTSYAKNSNQKIQKSVSGLKVATLNVLTNDVPIMDEVVCTPQRFSYTCGTILSQVDADVICLNEVSAAFVPVLLAQDWVQRSFVSSCQDAGHCRPRGSIL
jgi:hypothetical protein